MTRPEFKVNHFPAVALASAIFIAFIGYGAGQFPGRALGVVTPILMVLLACFISNNAKRLARSAAHSVSLERRGSELAAQLSQKTHDLDVMLKHINIGVASVIPGNIIHPDYSNYLTTLFRLDNLGGKDLLDSLFGDSLLGPDARAGIASSLGTILGADALLYDCNEHLLPREMKIEVNVGRHKIIRMDWSPIVNDLGIVEKILLVTQDVTQLRELEESAAQQQVRSWGLMTARGSFVSNEQLSQIKLMATALAAGNANPEIARLHEAADQLGLISLSSLVSGAAAAIAAVAAELNKPTPAVHVVNGDIGFNNRFAEALKSSLLHIVRNSLDYGIEDTLSRRRAKKPTRGTVSFACERHGEHLELHIRDDGRGLALHELQAQGLTDGTFKTGEHPAPEAVADVIFRSGLTTAPRVPRPPGRGVGMDVVRGVLAEQGATIRIALTEGGAESEFTPFEFVIDLPPAACLC